MTCPPCHVPHHRLPYRLVAVQASCSARKSYVMPAVHACELLLLSVLHRTVTCTIQLIYCKRADCMVCVPTGQHDALSAQFFSPRDEEAQMVLQCGRVIEPQLHPLFDHHALPTTVVGDPARSSLDRRTPEELSSGSNYDICICSIRHYADSTDYSLRRRIMCEGRETYLAD